MLKENTTSTSSKVTVKLRVHLSEGSLHLLAADAASIAATAADAAAAATAADASIYTCALHFCLSPLHIRQYTSLIQFWLASVNLKDNTDNLFEQKRAKTHQISTAGLSQHGGEIQWIVE